MKRIEIPGGEYWDEINEQFIYKKPQIIQIEHSLVSIAKWESKWHKPFLQTKQLTIEESLDYLRCMTLTQNVDPYVYLRIDDKTMQEINDYISDPMTATWFSDQKKKGNKEVITAEIIYYWMVALGIPFECQKWHLNRLLTLVQVCNIKNSPSKKMRPKEILANNAALNAARRKALNTKG